MLVQKRNTYILTYILHECTQELGLISQRCFALPPTVSLHAVLVLAVAANTYVLSPAPAKKGSYVQRWQESISNFLYNDCSQSQPLRLFGLHN